VTLIVKITHDHIKDVRTDNGGMTGSVESAIADAFGLDRKIAGWLKSVIGREIDEKAWEEIKALRLVYSGKHPMPT
jgi:hypothetical protein